MIDEILRLSLQGQAPELIGLAGLQPQIAEDLAVEVVIGDCGVGASEGEPRSHAPWLVVHMEIEKLQPRHGGVEAGLNLLTRSKMLQLVHSSTPVKDETWRWSRPAGGSHP